MEDNMERHIKEKLQDREIQPSASAWERLSAQLDEVESKKKRHWFFYVGYAASILLLISLVIFMNRSEIEDSPIPDNIIVNDDNPKPQLDTKKEFVSTPVEEVVVDNSKVVKKIQEEENRFKPEKVIRPKLKTTRAVQKEETVVANDMKIELNVNVQQKIKEITEPRKTVIAHSDTTVNSSRISVDSDALLMSVTSSREELRAYYKKYKIDRAEVLLAIQKELKKSKVKVNPETILAEVELEVNEENFQNNFYQFIKKRVSTVATAIANRNN